MEIVNTLVPNKEYHTDNCLNSRNNIEHINNFFQVVYRPSYELTTAYTFPQNTNGTMYTTNTFKPKPVVESS